MYGSIESIGRNTVLFMDLNQLQLMQIMIHIFVGKIGRVQTTTTLHGAIVAKGTICKYQNKLKIAFRKDTNVSTRQPPKWYAIDEYLTDDNFIETEVGGSVTFQSAKGDTLPLAE